MQLQTKRRGAGKAQQHRLAPCSTEPLLDRVAHKFGSVTVGEDETRPHRDDRMREVGGDGKIEAVAGVAGSRAIFRPSRNRVGKT